MIVRLWMMVIERPTLCYSGGPVWCRDLETGQVPDIGDSVVLYPDPDDGPADGPLADVVGRSLAADGLWHVELCRIWIQPSDDIMFSAQRGFASIWDAEDGDPRPGMSSAGWRLKGAHE